MQEVTHVIKRSQYNEYFRKAIELGGHLKDQPWPMSDYDGPGKTRISFTFSDHDKADEYYEWGLKRTRTEQN